MSYCSFGERQQGKGTSRDYAAAMTWYQRAADAGVLAANNSLAEMFEKGQRLFSSSLPWSSAHVCCAAWGIIATGEGVKPDYVKAFELYEKAAHGTSPMN